MKSFQDFMENVAADVDSFKKKGQQMSQQADSRVKQMEKRSRLQRIKKKMADAGIKDTNRDLDIEADS